MLHFEKRVGISPLTESLKLKSTQPVNCKDKRNHSLFSKVTTDDVCTWYYFLTFYVPEFNVLDVFYLSEDETCYHKARRQWRWFGKPFNSMESKRLSWLRFCWSWLPQHHYSFNKQLINSIEDLNSLKIRSASNPTQISAHVRKLR